eukprot:3938170-Rhodomonas_salina.3
MAARDRGRRLFKEGKFEEAAGIALRARYAMPGTDLAYAATSRLHGGYLRYPPYALPGTDVAYAATS